MAGLERSRYSYQEKEYKRGRSFFDLRCGFRRKSWRSVPCILACETEFLLAGALKKYDRNRDKKFMRNTLVFCAIFFMTLSSENVALIQKSQKDLAEGIFVFLTVIRFLLIGHRSFTGKITHKVLMNMVK